MKKNKHFMLRGFTLIELMIAISIIGILLTLSTTAFKGARSSSRDAQRKTDLQSIRSALEQYRSDCGSYPAALTFGSALVGSGATNCPIANTYMTTVPNDPQNTQKGLEYEYVPAQNNRTYTLCVALENSTVVGSSCAGSANATDRCRNTQVASCNYSLTNP